MRRSDGEDKDPKSTRRRRPTLTSAQHFNPGQIFPEDKEHKGDSEDDERPKEVAMRGRATSDPKTRPHRPLERKMGEKKPRPTLERWQTDPHHSDNYSETSSSHESSDDEPPPVTQHKNRAKDRKARPKSEDMTHQLHQKDKLALGLRASKKLEISSSDSNSDSEDEDTKKRKEKFSLLQKEGVRMRDKRPGPRVTSMPTSRPSAMGDKRLSAPSSELPHKNSKPASADSMRVSGRKGPNHQLAKSDSIIPSEEDALGIINALVDGKPANLVASLPGPIAQHAQHIMMRQRMMKDIWHQIFANDDGIVLPAHNFEVRLLLQREVDRKAEILAYARDKQFGKIVGNRQTVFDFLLGNKKIAEDFLQCKGVYPSLVAKAITGAQAINDATTSLSAIKKRIHAVIGDKKWTEYSRTSSYLNVIDDSLKSYTPENAVYVMKLIGDGRYNKAVAAGVYTSSAIARFVIEQYKKEFDDNEARLKSSYESVDDLLEKLVICEVIEKSEQFDDEEVSQYNATLDFHAMMYIVYDVWDNVIKEQAEKIGSRIRTINDIHPVKLTEQTLNMLSALMQYMVERREVEQDFYFDEDLVGHVVEEFRSLISKNLTSVSFFSRVFGYLNATQANLAFASVSSRTLIHQLRFLGQTHIDSQLDYGKQDYLIRQRFEKLVEDMRIGKFPSVVLFQSLLCELGLADQSAVGATQESEKDKAARIVLHTGFGRMFQYIETADSFIKKRPRFKGKQSVLIEMDEVMRDYNAMLGLQLRGAKPDANNMLSIPRSMFLVMLKDVYEIYGKRLPRQYHMANVPDEVAKLLLRVLSDLSGDDEFQEEFISSFIAVLYELGVTGIVSMQDIKEGIYYARIKTEVLSYITSPRDIRDFRANLRDIAQDKQKDDLVKRAEQVELRKTHSLKISKDLQEGVFIAQKFFRTVYEVSVTGDALLQRGRKVEDRELSYIMDIIASDIGSHAGVKATKVEQRMVGLSVTMSKTFINYLIERFMPQRQNTAFYMALMNLHGFKYVEYVVHRLVSEYQKRIVKEDQKYATVFEKFQGNIVDLFNTCYISPNVSEDGEIISSHDMECVDSMNSYIRVLAATMRTLAVFIDHTLQDDRRVEKGSYLNEMKDKLRGVQRKEREALNKIPPQDRAAIAIAIFNALCEQFMIPEATGALPFKFQHTAITKIAENIALNINDQLKRQADGSLWLQASPESLKDIVNGCLKAYIKANEKIKERMRNKRREDEMNFTPPSSIEPLEYDSDLEDSLEARLHEGFHSDGEEPETPKNRFKAAAKHVMLAGKLMKSVSEPITKGQLDHSNEQVVDPEIQQKMAELGLQIVSPPRLRKARESLKQTGNTSSVNIRTSINGNIVRQLASVRRNRPSIEHQDRSDLNREIEENGRE